MKTLVIDIETTPNLAYVWGLWDQSVGLHQLVDAGQVLCFAAKWHGEKAAMFFDNRMGQGSLAAAAHALLDEADAVVHYNGNSFDIPHLHREILLAGIKPPSPHKNIDLLRAVKKRFKFPSNKLAYVSSALGLGGKAETGGFETWVGCMMDEDKAWRRMKKYNIQDVRLTEELYDRLLPWIDGHPHHGLFNGRPDSCLNCGGTHLQSRGYAYTALRRYRQYQCQGCGRWLRGSASLEGATVQAAV